jgi:DNA-binding transcriptional ArsR family regulator
MSRFMQLPFHNAPQSPSPVAQPPDPALPCRRPTPPRAPPRAPPRRSVEAAVRTSCRCRLPTGDPQRPSVGGASSTCQSVLSKLIFQIVSEQHQTPSVAAQPAGGRAADPVVDGTADPAPGPAAQHPPGSAENPLKLKDPRKLRALAHPARIAILEHLAIEGPATATECAEVAGLSPSACSYHLRALAQHGFVEEDLASAADGRQRPWRARVLYVSFGEPNESSAVRAAGRLLDETVRASIEEQRDQWVDRKPEYPVEWQNACGYSLDVLHVTADELRELRSELRDLLARFRRLDRADRPEGARRVHALLELIPWFGPDAE